MARKLVIVDLLCGAGGFSTACIEALRELGWSVEEIVHYCLNHWRVAIETHRINNPHALHFCQDIATARPHLIVKGGYVDLLMASPTCTHHSVARGGKPTSDQQRADPWHIITWFTELRVKRAIIENVWEYTSWGPVDPRTGRPVKGRKGEYHRAWIDTIKNLGATSIEWKKLNSANYGGTTTRVRYVNKIRFDKVQVGWAPVTHQKCLDDSNLELFPTLKPWRPAREIIDWSIRGRSIFGRPIPLAPKTLARIVAGAEKFDWPWQYLMRIAGELQRSLRYYIGRAFGKRHALDAEVRKRARKRLKEYIAWLRNPPDIRVEVTGIDGEARPIIVTLRNNVVSRLTSEPVPALAANGGHIGIAEPFMLSTGSSGAPRSTREPMPTATTGGAGSEDPGCARPMLVEPFVLNRHGDNGGVRAHSADEPLPASDCRGAGYLVEPFMLSRHGGGAPRSVGQPTPTQVAQHSQILIAPYYGSGSGETCTSGDDPLPTLTAKPRFGMVMPVTHSDGSGRARNVDAEPVPTLTCAKRGELAFVTAQFGERPGQAPRVHDIAAPVEGIENFDVLFRMFEVHELAAAMGLNRDGVRYQFTGTKTEQVKQIGNAVEHYLMKAEIKALMADAKPGKARRQASKVAEAA